MALLLVPGYMLDETLWDDMRDRLAPFGPLAHADLRHDSTLEAMARRALASAPPTFILIGFSLGGYVAREIVRLAPERVRALVLIATSTRPDSPALREKKGAVAKAAPSVSFSGLSRTAIASSLHPRERDNAGMIERVRMMGVRLGGETFRRQSMLERPGDCTCWTRSAARRWWWRPGMTGCVAWKSRRNCMRGSRVPISPWWRTAGT